MKYNDNGTYKDIYVKTFDTLPVGAIVEYSGSTIPSGWTDIGNNQIQKTSQYIEGGAGLPSYFTDEIDTGMKWVDGKPIYRKVFQIPEITSQYTTNISSLSIENLINIYGSLQTGTGSGDDRIPLSTWFSASYNVATTVKVGTGVLSVAWNGWSKLYSGIVVLEYTKTTD